MVVTSHLWSVQLWPILSLLNFSIFENTLVRITYNHYLTEEVTFLRETDQNKSLDFLLNPFRFMYVSLYNCIFVTTNVRLTEINMFKPIVANWFKKVIMCCKLINNWLQLRFDVTVYMLSD